MHGVFELILAAFQYHVEGFLGRFGSLFWDQNGAKNETKNGPKFGPDFGTENVPKQAPKTDPKMYQNGFFEKSWPPAGFLRRFLATSRPSLSLLDPP